MKSSTTLKFIFNSTKKRLPLIIGLVATSMIGALCSVLFALASRSVIDTATGADSSISFTLACVFMAGVIAVIIVMRALSKHFEQKASAMLDIDWKKKMFGSILRANYSSISAYHSGELINRMTMDARTVDDGLIKILPGFGNMIIRFVSAIVVMIALEPKLTLIICGVGLAAVLGTSALRRMIKTLHKSAASASGKIASLMQETAENLIVVQSLDTGTEIEKRSDKLLDERWQILKKRKNLGVLSSIGIGVMCYGLEFIALFWCAKALMRGETTFGTLTAIVQLVAQLETPFVNFSSILPSYISMLGSAERIAEICEVPSDMEAPMDGAQLYEKLQSIKSEDLFFAYPDTDKAYVIKKLNIEIKKGEFVAITGQSGAGKSTLLKLMMGIYPADTGRLFAQLEDGQVELSRKTRKLFAFVPQGNLLFSGTLRDNLLLTNPTATDEEIAKAIEVSDLSEFIASLPDGLDSVLGENAEGISEGQAQRVNIARGVLSGAPIMLLDEVSSALDADTEEKVLGNLSKLPNRTFVAVTHRPRALAYADSRIEIE